MSESKGDEIVIFEDDVEAGEKVTSTLKSHYDYWEESGASEFAKSVIRNGYIPSFSEMPPRYRELNNKSYKENKCWANEAVAKIVAADQLLILDGVMSVRR